MITETKTDPKTGHVYVVRYGFDLAFARRHSQLPHLSVTGEHWSGEPMRGSEDNLIGMGCLHNMVEDQFPEVAPLIPFHLHTAPDGAPMHYKANAIYWHDHVTGKIKHKTYYTAGYETPDMGRNFFLDHVCADVPGVGPVPDEVFSYEYGKLEQWLDERLPLIREAMRKACLAAGVGWPE